MPGRGYVEPHSSRKKWLVDRVKIWEPSGPAEERFRKRWRKNIFYSFEHEKEVKISKNRSYILFCSIVFDCFPQGRETALTDGKVNDEFKKRAASCRRNYKLRSYDFKLFFKI